MVLRNRKGNNATEPITIIIILIIFATLTFGLFKFGAQLSTNPNSELNNESILYIAEQQGFRIEDKSLDAGVISGDRLDSPFYSKDGNVSVSDKDQALEFLYYREQSISWRGLVNSLYNLPSYLIGNLGLDLEEWKFVVNAWNVIAWGLIFFIIYKIVRGAIK